MLAAGIGRIAGILLIIRAPRSGLIPACPGDGCWPQFPWFWEFSGGAAMTASRVVFSLCGLGVLIVGAVMLVERLRDSDGPKNPPDIIDAL